MVDAIAKIGPLTKQRDAAFFAGKPYEELEVQIAEAAQAWAGRGSGYFAPTLEDIAIIVTVVHRSGATKFKKVWDESSNLHTKTGYKTFKDYLNNHLCTSGGIGRDDDKPIIVAANATRRT